MKFDIVTIFPRMFDQPLAEGVVARGVEAGVIDLKVHDLRDFTTDRHRVVDDVPYGGGPGMVMKPEPFFRAAEHIRATRGEARAVLHVVILCGRYEGIDDRVRQQLATEEISLGDYVLSGGELAALVIVDVVSRLVPGVVGDRRSVEADSFSRGLLDYPHYTRPAEFQGLMVPEVLLSGHHQEIARWRAREAVRRTMALRPELLADAALDELERVAHEQAVRETEGVDHERD